MTAKRSYHGGLQFNGKPDGALERFGHIAATTLQDYGHLIERKKLLSPQEASIVTSQYLVRLTLEVKEEVACDRYETLDRTVGLKTISRKSTTLPPNRLTITICPVSDLMDDSEISELMLVVILYRMVDICSTLRIEWLSPNTVLTVEQFMSAFDSIAPRKPRDRKKAFDAISGQFTGLDLSDDGDIDQSESTARPIKLTDEQLLSLAFREDTKPTAEAYSENATPETDEIPSDILRLTSWGMTGAIASISGPVAISLAAVNLIRGEDFRLSTQVLSLTVAIFALNATNAFAGVASAIGM
ncbi:hypothetical protein [Ruegeria arenilitoris]|uniref:hypothetical protein n=1 Tax=Ruegeria arenilitoris TaxID=1173585 RepID=UPI001480DCB0